MSGTLYIVATPIGNLEDITLRGLRVLKEVDLVISEDTRVVAKLLSHFEIEKPTMSYHQQSNDYKKAEILNKLLGGTNIALVTDAGTPGISDPGNELVQFVMDNSIEIKIVPIPGASSLTTALSVSGFDVSNFTFIGFWPKKKALKTIKMIRGSDSPVVFFESPYRIIKTLDFLIKELGEKRQIFVGRELTKVFETLYRGNLKEVKAKMLDGKIKGEIVCILSS